MRISHLLLVLSLAAAGCSKPARPPATPEAPATTAPPPTDRRAQCEAARPSVVAYEAAKVAEGVAMVESPEKRAQEEERGKFELAYFEAHFVDACVEVADLDLACLGSDQEATPACKPGARQVKRAAYRGMPAP